MSATSTLRPPQHVLILGCGFTGLRVARKLLEQGISVVATSRHPENLPLRGARIERFDALADGDLARLTTLVDLCDAVVCSIPTLRVEDELIERVPEIVAACGGKPARFLYLSTTGVYGSQLEIDEFSTPRPTTPRELLRVEAEQSVLSGFASPLVLRPAAIYGPGRGVHVSIQSGKYRLTGDGSNYISRIHVDDLSAHVVAALCSEVAGAWPVADEHPCSQKEMASFCSELLGLPLPPSAASADTSETLRANRRVDGAAIRARLGIRLRYPSYREGVPASIAEEIRSAGESS